MKEQLSIAMDIGEAMLLSGAEVHRVEDSINRIMASFGAVRTDVFIITTSMMATAHGEDGEAFTETRRITTSGVDFEKLDKLNALSRRICYEEMSYAEIKAELKKVSATKPYPFFAEVIAYAIIAGAFTFFFGGTPREALVSLLIGAFIRLLVLVSDRMVGNKIFTKFLASFSAAGAAYLFMHMEAIPDVDEVIIGNIMTLISGVGFTNALRDLFIGDSIAGILRTIEAVLTALAIAAGYFLMVLLLGGGGVAASPPEFIPWLQIITGALGTVGFAVLYNIKNKKLIAVAAGGIMSWSVYLLVEYLTENEVLGYFTAAVVMSVYSELMARILKTPTTTFIIPTLIPLVPGGSLYKTMSFALSGSASLFRNTGLHTLKLAAALALGIMITSVIAKPIIRFINIKSHRRSMIDKNL